MEKDTKAMIGDVDAKPLPAPAEPTSPPSLILQAVSGASLEGLSTTRATMNRALDEYRQGNFTNAESTLVKLKGNLERLIARTTEEKSADLAEPSLLCASTATALGRVYMQLDREPDAQVSFKEAVALFQQWLPPVDGAPQNYSDYGIALYMVGQKDEAIATLKQAHGLGSKTAETYIYLGLILKERGQYAAAEECLREAVDAAPADPMAHKLLAQVLESQGPERYREAVQTYCAAAFALASNNGLEGGLEILNQALRLNPESAVALTMKGEILRLLNRNDEALVVVEQALALDSSDVLEQLQVTKGGALQALGQSEKALQEVEKALSLHSGNSLALSIKGQALHSLNRNQEAVEILKQSLSLDPGLDWLHAELGSVYYDLGNYSEALESLDRSLNLNPNYVWALWLKGESLRALGRPGEALSVLDRALELKADNPTLLIARSETLRLLGRFEEALQVIEKTLELTPDSAYALGTKGQILHGLNRNEEAVKVLTQCVAIDPDLNWVHVELGATFLDLSQLSESLESLDRALKLKPDDPRTLSIKAHVLGLQSRNDEAITLLKRVIEINPNVYQTYIELAEVLIAAGSYEESLNIVNQGADIALSQDPDNVSMLVVKGQVLNALGRYDEAIGVLQQCVKTDPGLDQAYSELGTAFLATDQDEQALQAVNQALALNENNASALRDKARLLSSQGRQAEAIELLRRSLELEPDEDLAFLALGEALRLDNRPTEALQALNDGLKLDPDNATALATKGQVLHLLAQNEEALEVLKRAVELDPKLGWAFGELAAVLFDLGRHDEALAPVNEALKIDEKDPFALGTKAEILEVSGQYEEAKQAVSKALTEEPDSSWLLIVKARVLNALAEYSEALEILERLLTKEPENVTALRYKGLALLSLNRNEKALEMFQQALSIEPENADVMVATAFTLLFDDKYGEDSLQKARRYLDEALKIEPEAAWAWSIKGATLCDLSEYEESIEALNKAIQLDPNDIDSRIYKGWACQCLATRIMQESLAREIEAEPVFHPSYSFKEWASKYDAVEHLQMGEEAYKSAVAIAPGNLWGQKGVGDIRYLLGDKEAADQIYESVLNQALQSGDLDASTLSLMGWCKFRLRQYDEAVRLFIENQSIIVGMLSSQFDLALALLSNKQYSLGLGEYKRGVSMAADRPRSRCRGLLSVACGDLLQAVMVEPSMWSEPEVREVLETLKESISNPTTPAAAAG